MYIIYDNFRIPYLEMKHFFQNLYLGVYLSRMSSKH